MRFDRRTLIKAGSGLALVAGVAPQKLLARPLGAYPFTLGVAAGDPWPDGFVIWTRLAPRPLDEHGGMPHVAVPVRWEVSADDRFSSIVRNGEALARPELGHSVHVEVGGLQPQRRYWYRFIVAGSDISPVGTAKTAPAAGMLAESVRIGVAGCQHWEAGFYDAWGHLSRESDLDLIFHYGDYIYEGASRPLGGDIVRQHVGGEIYSLDDYRRRHAQYKTDPHLQAAHAASAFAVSFDDHEVDNNWAGDHDQDGTPPEIFLLRRACAMQAWYENMPVRQAQFPSRGRPTMHRRLDYGDLLRIHLLDTRQYRTDQLCPANQAEHCRKPQEAPSHILGADQERWLGQGLSGDHRWNLLAQQVMVMPFAYPESRKAGVVNTDSWSGYPDARQRLVNSIRERELGNVVIATGDVHKHHVGVLPSVEGDLASAPVATEYVCTSASSGGDGADFPVGWEGVPERNPHTAFVNDRRGYQLFDITRNAWQTSVMAVERVSVAGAPKRKVAAFVTEQGRPGANAV